jgi:PTS system fructose-specific IIC component
LSSGNVVIFGLVAGLLVAFDVGGVFSKTTLAGAFALVGTGALVPQAAVMAAAIAAPLGLALATVIAKDKFTPEEKELGNASWLLGLSALTEGIIPFAASDPIRVIPAAMVGSSVTGLLTALFGAEINVSNGGIFALTVSGAVTGVLGILVSIIVGAVVTAYLIKFLKK